ncbi:MAG: IS200/IS605 family transposase, partial [Candidatus Lokiarchaeota archaeon]|nr:IS200/IS605 family transposase [Candidatus Lokiarchaeota archaeon]
MEYRKDAHRVYSLMVHLIFGVKSRQPAFIEEIDIIEALKTKIIELSENVKVKVVEIKWDMNHVHLLISPKPMLDIP